VKLADTAVAKIWLCKQPLLLDNGWVAITWSPQQTRTQQRSNGGTRCFLRGPSRDKQDQLSSEFQENISGLNLTAVKLTTVQVTKLPL
jgi:hypothetical protein